MQAATAGTQCMISYGFYMERTPKGDRSLFWFYRKVSLRYMKKSAILIKNTGIVKNRKRGKKYVFNRGTW